MAEDVFCSLLCASQWLKMCGLPIHDHEGELPEQNSWNEFSHETSAENLAKAYFQGFILISFVPSTGVGIKPSRRRRPILWVR
jgi:hypothetical protein